MGPTEQQGGNKEQRIFFPFKKRRKESFQSRKRAVGKIRMEYRVEAVESIGLKKKLAEQPRQLFPYVNDLSVV